MPMREQAKYILQLILGLSITAAIGTWILNLIWLPLAVPFLLCIVFGGIGCTLRTRFLFLKTPTSASVALISCIWGGLVAALAGFGSLYVNSPSWLIVFTYLIGVFAAGYLGYRTPDELELIGMSGIKDYHALSQVIGIMIYACALLGLHLLY
jgi:hypothetical protein